MDASTKERKMDRDIDDWKRTLFSSKSVCASFASPTVSRSPCSFGRPMPFARCCSFIEGLDGEWQGPYRDGFWIQRGVSNAMLRSLTKLIFFFFFLPFFFPNFSRPPRLTSFPLDFDITICPYVSLVTALSHPFLLSIFFCCDRQRCRRSLEVFAESDGLRESCSIVFVESC